MRKIESALLLFLACVMLLPSIKAAEKPFAFSKGQTVSYKTDKNLPLVVRTALDVVAKDMRSVLDASFRSAPSNGAANIVVHTLKAGEKDALAGRHEAFRMEMKSGVLHITGSDANGTAYGVGELSRLLGVSPWVWWADNVPGKLNKWSVPADYKSVQEPAVAYRGIFINDEDWGMCPWSWKTDDPSDVSGRIGPKTHERIFELLLRLRANTFWPAMHECSVPFFFTEGNREMADKYGITIGTSHCEPMQRNTNGEWRKVGVGEYDFIHNRQNVLDFWENRVKEVAHSNNYFTLGMRGIHDSGMLGVKSVDEGREALTEIIKEQRNLIAKYINKDVTKVPQVFIPYKEVLEIYHSGLKVPDDVTLMWVDDNYGYIRYLPNEEEQARSGGSGLYYHISYWGRPHDYLWLGTTSPALMQTELERAYQKNVRKLWVLNVGDIKPGEFLLEYCMDMAWDKNILGNRDCTQYIKTWLTREFGAELAEKLLPLYLEYNALNYQCRPEFLGNSRTYDKTREEVADLPWSDAEVAQRLVRFEQLEKSVKALAPMIDEVHRAHWFELIEYPFCACSEMNRKMLGAQLARHGKGAWSEAVAGFNDIARMTERYNTMLDGKWKNMMDFQPRQLSVFAAVDTTKLSGPITGFTGKTTVIKPSEGTFGKDSYLIKELGYSREALSLAKNDVFTAEIPASKEPLQLVLAFVPNNPVGTKTLEVKVSVEGETPAVVHFQPEYPTEDWMQDVIFNQARRTIQVAPSASARKITVEALTPAVVLDEIIARE